MRVLLVEDDRMIADAVEAALLSEHYTVDTVRDGLAADKALRAGTYDLVLLDLGLPQRDGLEVLGGLSTRGVKTPVLIVTARETVRDRIAGLDAGADDYLVKPF